MPASITTTLDELIRLKADARGFSFLPRQPVTSLLAGQHASRLRGRGLIFEELRQYAQGDDVRTIDWKATARLRQTHVRVYNEERERPVLMIVDQRSSMFFGSQRAMKSVVAAELAALGAWRALASGDRVGGLVFSDSEVVELSPQRSQSGVLRLLHEIVRLNQKLTDQPETVEHRISLNQILEAAVRRAKHDYLVVIISDFEGADAETQRLVTLLAAHNDVLAVAVYDPLGAALRGGHGMIASCRDATYELPAEASFSAAFQQTFVKRLDEWMAVFRGLRVPVIPISTGTKTVDQLREIFGTRRPHGAGK